MGPRRQVRARTQSPYAEEEEDVVLTDVPAGATVTVETPQEERALVPARSLSIPRGNYISSFPRRTISRTTKRTSGKRKRTVKKSNLKVRLTKDLKGKRKTLEKEIRQIDADLKSIGAKRSKRRKRT